MFLKEKIFCLAPVLGIERVEFATIACGPPADTEASSDAMNAHDRLAGNCDGGTNGRHFHSAIATIIATPTENLLSDSRAILAGLELAHLGRIGWRYGLSGEASEKFGVDVFGALCREAKALAA